MTFKVWVITTGQLGNNVSILFDEETKEAIVVDPSYEPEFVYEFLQYQQLSVSTILLTHGHFDHFAGISYLNAKLPTRPGLGMHRDDLEIFMDGGGSKNFHIPIEPPGDPDFYLEDGQEIKLGDTAIQVRWAPGHTPGSVIFYIPAVQTAVCGDVIFYHSVGRTDLPGGSHATLLRSIAEKVMTLPPETRLIPGHGEETTVNEEMHNNPFLVG